MQRHSRTATVVCCHCCDEMNSGPVLQRSRVVMASIDGRPAVSYASSWPLRSRHGSWPSSRPCTRGRSSMCMAAAQLGESSVPSPLPPPPLPFPRRPAFLACNPADKGPVVSLYTACKSQPRSLPKPHQRQHGAVLAVLVTPPACKLGSARSSTATSFEGTIKMGPILRRVQRTVGLRGMPRGCHIVTRELLKQLPEIADFQVGMPSKQ